MQIMRMHRQRGGEAKVRVVQIGLACHAVKSALHEAAKMIVDAAGNDCTYLINGEVSVATVMLGCWSALALVVFV